MAIHRIGLTGGIGSGKSTVAAVWVELGAVLVDTDAIAHGLTAAGGLAMPALIDRFGPEVADAHGATFGEIRPATAIVEVSKLINPDMMVEIEAEAIIGSGA